MKSEKLWTYTQLTVKSTEISMPSCLLWPYHCFLTEWKKWKKEKTERMQHAMYEQE